MHCGLNGKDLWLVFGIKILKGSDPFISYPDAKPSVEHDFQEESGIDKDLSSRTFLPRTFTLKCLIKAINRDDFFNKYDGLFAELSGPGTIELYHGDNNKTYIVYYSKQQNLTKLTRLDSQYIGLTFDLILSELNPFDNIRSVYLVDESDNYIIG